MRKIAIIGASYLQLPLVKKAKEMSLEIHCFAWEEHAVCKEYVDYFYPISVLDKESIYEVCKNVQIDAITSIASDIVVPTITYIVEKLNLIGNSFNSSKICTNKFYMRKAFEKNDIKTPFYYLDDELILDKLEYPVIVKPTDRSGSKGITMVNKEMELNKAIDIAKKASLTNNAIIEQFIKGKEYSVETISFKNTHYLLAITEKETTGSPHFVETAHHQPAVLNDIIKNKIQDIVFRGLSTLEIKYGAGHTELIITEDDEIFIIEIGARMGGDFIGSDLVQLSTGFDFLKGVIDVSLGEFEVPKLIENNYSGIYFFYKENSYKMDEIDKISDENIYKKEFLNKEFKSISESSDRSGYIIYKSPVKKIIL